MRAARSPTLAESPALASPPAIAVLIWRNLPLLVAIDALILLAVLPAAGLAVSGHVAAAPLAAALFVGPLWAATVATTDELLRQRVVSLGLVLGNLGRHARTGISVGLPPAVLASLTVLTMQVLAAGPKQPWLLVPLFLDGCAATVVILAQPALFSLATASRLRGAALWKAALGVAALRPSTIIGLLAIALLLWLIVAVSGGPGLLLFVPAPLAVYFSATTSAALCGFSSYRPPAADSAANAS